MNQYLSTYSIISLYHIFQQNTYYLSAHSIIKNHINLTTLHQHHNFQNTLFYIEVQGNNMEFNVPIEYDQPISFRHKISKKYLSIIADEEEEDTKYKLTLGNQKKYFKINPCFQYQIKISNKIKFNQQIYLSTSYTSLNSGSVVVEIGPKSLDLYLSFTKGSKFLFHFYSLYEKEEKYYRYGMIVWISHIQRNNFLSMAQIKGKQQIVFQQIKYQKQIQNLSALWVLQPKDITQGKRLKYDQQITFKNLYNGQYLCFSRNYKLIDNERIYNILMQNEKSDYSKFLFRSVVQKQNKDILLNSYLSLQHNDSNLYIGCRKQRIGEIYYKLLTFSYMDDEDLFKLNTFSLQEQQALRLIFSIRQQYKQIAKLNNNNFQINGLNTLKQIQQTYINIKQQLVKLKRFQKIFIFVTNQLGSSIRLIVENMQFLKKIKVMKVVESNFSKKREGLINNILKLGYDIISILCVNNQINQKISFQFVSYYITDMSQFIGAEEIIIETFKNNPVLLPFVSHSSKTQPDQNLIKTILIQFLKKNKQKQKQYWQNLLKIICIFNTFIVNKNIPFDINQFTVSEQLFKNGYYQLIFPPLHISGQKITVFDSNANNFIAIENIKDNKFQIVVYEIFNLFSNLVDNHSLNAKQYIHGYLSTYNQACISIFIKYLRYNIKKELYNALLNFISKCYIDSSPRIKRIKPYSFIFFIFQDQKTHIEHQEAYYSDRLKEVLILKAEESKVCKPLHYSNLIEIGRLQEPSMTDNQIVSFRLNLTQKILNSNSCSKEELQTIQLLLSLQSYTINEILQLYEQFKGKIMVKGIEHTLLPRILQIFYIIFLNIMQLQIKKLKLYLQYKFMKDIAEDEYKYMLPLSNRIFVPFANKNKNNNIQAINANSHYLDGSFSSNHKQQYKSDYNQLRDTLALLHATPEMKKILMNYFCEYSNSQNKDLTNNSDYLVSIFNMIIQTHLPKYTFLILLSKATVLTHQEVAQFDHLFNLAKKIQYLVLISQTWILVENQTQNTKLFLDILKEFTNFMFQNGSFGQSRAKVNIKKQLIVGNMGIHKIILDLLQKNHYIILSVSKKDIKKKHKQIFQLSFTFIYYFIKQCTQNKKLLYNYYSILMLYLECIELGQIKVYTQFYKDEKDYVKEINFTMIEKIIYLIIKQPNLERNYQICVYNPDYLNLLIVIIQALDVQSKFFIQKLYQFISNVDIFHKLLFLDAKNQGKSMKFCFKIHKIKLQPLQIPIFYHIKLFKLIYIMLENSSELVKNALKIKLLQFISLQYLLQLLAQPDIFSNLGILPQANFILKSQLQLFTTIILQKTQLYSQLYQSDNLRRLLNFYQTILLKPIDKKQINIQNQQLVLQYIQQYNPFLNLYQNNKGHYYHLFIKPFIVKLHFIFDKYLKNTIKNRNKDAIQELNTKLAAQFSNRFMHKGQSTGINYGLNDIKLKWRNFVDEDEENSKEEKYAKKMILDLLKSKKTAKFVTQQLTSFYESIRQNLNPFIKTMIKLIQILSSIKQIDDGRKKQINTLQKALKYFSGFITYMDKEDQIKIIIQTLQDNNFIELIIGLTNRKQFELSKMHLKNIFYYALTIINYLLEKDHEMKFNKILYKRFKEITYTNKFLQFLKDGALEIISTIDSSHYYQQINEALKEMRLSVQNQPNHLYQASFKTLTFLCRYEPFTFYLRKQSSINSIDFLDKIYNIIGFIFNNPKNLSKNLNISSVRAAEFILDFIISMFNGGNQSNQNYIMDNKFGDLFHQVLKIKSLDSKQKNPIRQDLLQKIVQFYKLNGIDIKDLLALKIGLIDFSGPYLLNRFKYAITRCLMQCLISNQNLPLQIVKLNLIWIFECFEQKQYGYTEQIILKQRKNWKDIIETKEKKQDELFFRLGFYYYQIIIMSKTQEQNQNIENEEKIVDEQKQKERIVKKFFASIRDYKQNKEILSGLDVEQFSEDMKTYYTIYYKALAYFQQKTGSIEVVLKDNIIKIYFPKIPLTEQLNDELMEIFQQKAVRISRNQKIKSLIQWQNIFYEEICGSDDYFKQIEINNPRFGKLLRIVKYQSQFLLLAWFACVINSMTLLYQNFNDPTSNFEEQTFTHLIPDASHPIHVIQLTLTLLNLTVALMIGIYLCTRKIPLRRSLLKSKFQKIKNQENKSQFFYVWSKILQQTIYQFLIVIFLSLCLVHTFFAAFPLVEIIRRIKMGRFIIRSLKQTWTKLLGGITLLIVFNFVCIQIVYVFFTNSQGYGQICMKQITCFVLYIDQYLKDGNGVMATTQSNYVNLALNFQLLFEILYIIFGLRIFLDIFSGTIIDKFSELREEQESIKSDEETICFICAQERFDLDLQYQGFELHVGENHNVWNYMKYLFYLRRVQTNEYGIIEHYINQCKKKQNEIWIPEQISIKKQEKINNQKEGQDNKNIKDKVTIFFQQKIRQLKRAHQKIQTITKDFNNTN